MGLEHSAPRKTKIIVAPRDIAREPKTDAELLRSLKLSLETLRLCNGLSDSYIDYSWCMALDVIDLDRRLGI